MFEKEAEEYVCKRNPLVTKEWFIDAFKKYNKGEKVKYLKDCEIAEYEAYIAGAEPREKRIEELEKETETLSQNLDDAMSVENCLKKRITDLEVQIEKMKKYGKLLQDICDVMGNDPYMVWRGLEQRVLILWDKSEEEKGLKMADDILERLLKISAIDWAEIEKWEIKEND